MKKNENRFAKTNIVNRFIAVKYSDIPPPSENSAVILPLNDGLGFQLKASFLKDIKLSPQDEEYILKELSSINNIIGKEYAKFQKQDLPKHLSRKNNDTIIFGSFFLNLIFFLFIQVSLFSQSEMFFYMGFGGYILILIILFCFLSTGLFYKLKRTQNFSKYLPIYIEPILKKMKAYLKEKGFKMENGNDYFWIKISKSKEANTIEET